MPIFEHVVMPHLETGRFEGLINGDELVMPSYDGFGLVNLTPTFAK